MNLETVVYINKIPQGEENKYVTILLQILQSLLGLDFGFLKHKSLKFRLTSYIFTFINCVVSVGPFILAVYKSLSGYYIFWRALYFLEYVFTVLLLSMFKRGTTVMDLMKSLVEIDFKLKVNFSRNHAELKFILMILFVYFVRFCICAYFYVISDYANGFDSLLNSYVYLFLSSCADIFLCSYTFVLYSLYLRLSKLASLLDTNDDVNFVHRLYKTIIDTVEKYKNAYDLLFMVLLLSNVPLIMVTIFSTLQQLRAQACLTTIILLSVGYIHSTLVLMVTLAPALTAEMLTTQAEKLLHILHGKLMLQDEHNSGPLFRFIRYVEARPCQFRVWQLIPLSADLLGMVLSFCVTYLIVIIQFTNK